MAHRRVVITRRGRLDVRDGINIYIFALAGELMRRGIDVSVVATSAADPGHLAYLYGMPRLPRLRVVNSREDRPSVKGLSMEWLTRGRRVIDRLRPDLVIHNGVVPFKTHGLTVGVAHDMGWRTSSSRLGVLRSLYKRLAYGRCDEIVAVCREVREALASELHREPHSVHVFPAHVDGSAHEPGSPRDREAAILHSGTDAYKDPAATVRAFALLGRACAARLYIEGTANQDLEAQLAELPEEIRQRIVLLGELGAADLRRLHRTVRVASFPTLYTVPTASSTVAEAVVEGTPIVGSSMISRDLLEDGGNGLVATDDADRAHAFQALLYDDDLWIHLAAGSTALASKLTVGRAADRYLSLLS